ncbi:peptidoglycan editing factor PgeF [Paenibacillus arenilitoris]|uniref:Purine nucleoside phosphorylase n=1 Tax=Paenibacillus arenilitoris TaxID=2772299 RepID=A0A927CQK3_9BACL|nr:peptidoglycan editing factor PgeF [Paenibacillus arenilitoris]MBD2870116.1 peptidoglycan editing factor PgeF [Paenibacillus arenilitoris]
MDAFERIKSAKGPSLFLLSKWKGRHEGLTAGFTGREGGTSKAPWASLNMGLHVGDRAEDVVRNRQRAAEALHWPLEAWTCAEQVHGSRVHRVTKRDRGRGRLAHEDAIPGCDAITTDVTGVLLASYYADCVPLYFHDARRGAVALAHAGWKGTVQRIATETIKAMERDYGSKPEEIEAAIGPSIGDCCYEVDGAVISQVGQLLDRLHVNAGARLACMQAKENGKANLNLKEINRQIMIKAGILPSHIEISQWCTGCRRDLFYSHRKEGGKTGRMASWIGIMER